METPFGSKCRVWLAPPDYGQRLQADVICFTYHDLVFSGVSRFYRVSGPAMYLTMRVKVGGMHPTTDCGH